MPNTLNISFEGIDSELLISYLNEEGIFVSSGSACTTGSLEPSHVLMAMGLESGPGQKCYPVFPGLGKYRRTIG
ncbi:MAG: aminotransferase class V-fold PLP-dependent enzyme [Actinomycetota bacterium]|nr:aminotransferase class V-fold PLP-dependent enzyme [Actinomycetota bacterium]